MSKKKRTHKGDSEQADDFKEFDLPDRRMMEKVMRDLNSALSEQDFESEEGVNAFLSNMASLGAPPHRRGSTPLEDAQDLMYEAFEARTGEERIRLARRALDMSPDCADAYVLLAEESATNLEDAIQLYEQGVQAGERALDSEIFEEGVGHFWGILETRPYMRARAGLAECLWEVGEQEDAIVHLQDMLRLNPNDNQGLRHILVDYLLDVDEDEALEALFQTYDDDATAFWTYSFALWLYRREGRSEAANRALDEALKYNPHVPPYLTGKRRLPRQRPTYYGFGDTNEAVLYVANARDNWRRTKGSLAWLNKQYVAQRKQR